MKGEPLEGNQSNIPIAGASPDPIFLLPERSAAPELGKGGRLKPQPKAPCIALRSLQSPSRKTAKLERFGRTFSHPVLHQRGSGSKRKGRPGLNTRATELTGKDARPARPAPDGRAGPLPALLQLPACPGTVRGPRPTPCSTPEGGRSPSPVPRQPAPSQ